MRARTSLATAVLLLAPLAACGGGSDTAAGGAPTVNWYIGNEGWLPDVIKACNEKAKTEFIVIGGAGSDQIQAGARSQVLRRGNVPYSSAGVTENDRLSGRPVWGTVSTETQPSASIRASTR